MGPLYTEKPGSLTELTLMKQGLKIVVEEDLLIDSGLL